MLRHAELARLGIAHVDCDAFYATIEKRDDPALAPEPVIVGGVAARRVVAAACYVARTYGVRSAMPMFEALRRCPGCGVVRPDMDKYSRVGREVRQPTNVALTPLVGAASSTWRLDPSGTERLHVGRRPRASRFAADVEQKLGITVSIGLSCNKFLAKIASDLDKPRGLAVLGASEAQAFLAEKPVSFIFGVGKVSAARFARRRLRPHRRSAAGQRGGADRRRDGEEGRRLARLARGIDARKVSADRETKSVSAETTFERDIADFRPLERILWSQAEEVSARLKAKALSGATITLKLKPPISGFRTRARSPARPPSSPEKSLPPRAACLNAKPTARNSACSASARAH